MKSYLKRIRRNDGLTLEQLGDACGVSKSLLHALEDDDRSPKLSTAYAISKVLGMSVYDIWPNELEVVEEEITVRRISIKKG